VLKLVGIGIVVNLKNRVVDRFILNRVYREDKDCVGVFIGERGGGKSTSAISWGYKLDRDQKTKESRFFLPDDLVPKELKLRHGEKMPRVVFRASDFMKLVSDYDLPAGSVIVLEEVGLMMDSREALSKTNRMLKKTFESIRSKNLIVFLTVPTLGSFDVGVRRSLTMLFDCQGISVINNKKYCRNRIITIQANSKTGKIYHHGIRWKEDSNFPKRLSWVNVPKPPDYIYKPYFRAKELYQRETYRNFNEELKAIDNYLGDVDEYVKPKKQNNESIIEKILQTPTKFFDYNKNKFVVPMIEMELGIGYGQAYKIKSYLDFQVKSGAIQITK